MSLKPERKDIYFDDQEEMPATARQLYLDRKLRAAVGNAWKYAPSARELMEKARLKPSGIRSNRSLVRLPITRKADLLELQKSRPPYGGFLAIKPEDVERVFISPGPLYEPFHSSKIKWFSRALWAAGFRKGDVVINTFDYNLSPEGMLLHEALRQCGATVVDTDNGSAELQLRTMRDLKVNGFVGIPSFLMTIIRKAEETGFNFRNDYGLKRAWFTGEMLTPADRELLENTYGIDTRQAYNINEVGGAIAYECPQKAGMHFMDDYVLEIVDPATGNQLKPGEVGELVVTPINNPAWGMIRFGTGDLSSYTTERCACGRTSFRLNGILGRTADAVKVGGEFLVAGQVDKALLGFGSIAHYQLIITRNDDRDELTLKAELQDETADRLKVSNGLNTQFQSACHLKLDRVDFLTPGTFPPQYPHILDERKRE
jgi:phenylacetate-CoA ligase